MNSVDPEIDDVVVDELRVAQDLRRLEHLLRLAPEQHVGRDEDGREVEVALRRLLALDHGQQRGLLGEVLLHLPDRGAASGCTVQAELKRNANEGRM